MTLTYIWVYSGTYIGPRPTFRGKIFLERKIFLNHASGTHRCISASKFTGTIVEDATLAEALATTEMRGDVDGGDDVCESSSSGSDAEDPDLEEEADAEDEGSDL